MEEKNYTGLVPDQYKGKEITAEAAKTLNSENEAIQFYEKACKKLLNVSGWQNLTGSLGAVFQLMNKEAKEKSGEAEKDDYFKINITGPGSSAGEGYDWVKVADRKEINSGDVQSIAITVTPSDNPQSTNNDIAHFYSEGATSTFVVTREGKKVTASVYDKNIEANQETENLTDKIRNSLVGVSAKLGMSKLQWQALANALVQDQ